MNKSDSKNHPFNPDYFSSGPYIRVSFACNSPDWWSNRSNPLLAPRYGPHHGKALELGCGMGYLHAWLACLHLIELMPRGVFSDGFWGAPYVPAIPAQLLNLVFGLL